MGGGHGVSGGTPRFQDLLGLSAWFSSTKTQSAYVGFLTEPIVVVRGAACKTIGGASGFGNSWVS